MGRNYNSGEDDNFRITALLDPGIYYIEVSDFNDDIGDYDLHVDVVTATEIELNTTVSGTIDSGNDVDYFSIDISTPTFVVIFTTGNLDTVGLLLVDRTNSILQLEFDDQSGEENNFLIRDRLNPGTYYILVGSFGTGDYILHVDVFTTTEIELNTSVSGTIDPADDIDYFSLEINTPTNVNIFTTGNLDTIGGLFDGTNTFLQSDDNSGGYPNFLISARLNPGTYYIGVLTFFGDPGDYILHVDVVTVTEIELNTPASGTIDPANDVDYFSLEINTPTNVNIFTTGNVDTEGSLQDDMGNELAGDDDSGEEGENFLIRARLNPGTYYIEVSTLFGDTGDYVLHIDELTPDRPLTLDVVPAELSIVSGNTGQITVDARAGDSTLVLTLSGLLNTTITLDGINDEVATILQATIEYSGGNERFYEPIEVEGDLNEFKSTRPPTDLSVVEAIVETIIDSAFWNDTYDDYQPATITMSVTRLGERVSADIVITIVDDKAPSLDVEPKELHLKENSTKQITVKAKNIKDTSDIKVMLTGLAGIEATTNPVILNASMPEATIILKAIDDLIYTGTRTETVMLKAEGYASAAFAVSITDNEVPTPLSLSMIPSVLDLERDSTGQIIVNMHVENQAIVLALEGLVNTTITLDGLNNEDEVMLMATVQYSGGEMDLYDIGKVEGDLDEFKSTRPPIDLSAIETAIETIIDSTFWDDTYNDYQPATITMSAARPGEQVSAELVVMVGKDLGDVGSAVTPAISLIIPSALVESTNEIVGSTMIDVKHGESFPVYISVAIADTAVDSLLLTLDGPQDGALPPTLMTSALGAGETWSELFVGNSTTTAVGQQNYRYCLAETQNCSASISVSYSSPAVLVVDINEISPEWDFTLSSQTATAGCSPDEDGTFPTLLSQEGNIFTSTGLLPEIPTYTGIVDGDSYSLAYRDPDLDGGTFIDTLVTRYSDDPVALSGQGAWWWTDRAGFLCHSTYNIKFTPRPHIDSIAVARMSVSEDVGAVTVTVTLTHPPVQPVAAMLKIEGTATNADYQVDRNINFGIGERQTTLDLDIVDDSLVELDETIILKAVSQDLNKLVGASSTALTIEDNDVPTISFQQAGYVIFEGTTGTITLVADQSPVVEAQIRLTTNSVTVLNRKYRLSTTIIVFEPGQRTASFEVSIIDDNVLQATQELRLSIVQLDSSATRETVSETMIRVKDDDAPIAGLAIVGDDIRLEEEDSATLRITLDRSFGQATTILIVTTGTATLGEDYTIGADDNQVMLQAGSTSVETTLKVIDNGQPEPDETIILTLEAGNNLIIDDEPGAQLTLIIEGVILLFRIKVFLEGVQ